MNCLKAYSTNGLLRQSHPWRRLSSIPPEEPPPQASAVPALPEEPTTCCMSGCANCVWIEYAEQLARTFEDGAHKSREIVLSKVSDPNMKAFLEMELRALDRMKADKDS